MTRRTSAPHGAIEQGRKHQVVRHCLEVGITLPQLIDSAIPEAIGPQAVVWAERSASTSFAARAVAQLDRPLKVTQTSHSAACTERVE